MVWHKPGIWKKIPKLTVWVVVAMFVARKRLKSSSCRFHIFQNNFVWWRWLLDLKLFACELAKLTNRLHCNSQFESFLLVRKNLTRIWTNLLKMSKKSHRLFLKSLKPSACGWCTIKELYNMQVVMLHEYSWECSLYRFILTSVQSL